MFITRTFAGACVLAACAIGAMPLAGSQPPEQARPTRRPAVPPAYAFLYSGMHGDAEIETARQTLPFTSITISHSACFGSCPVYSATINLDGSASYRGERFVERTGRFTGKVFLGDFGHLSLLIERSDFMGLADRYEAPWTDDATVTVTVTRRSGGTKKVANYGGFAPPEVWALEHAIDAVVARIKWTADGAK